jgi:hypothetical protein
MRVRISRKAPAEYGIDGDSLRVGRVYNLDSSLASALMLEGCAELYDLLTPEEKRATVKLMSGEDWTGKRRLTRLPRS